jgi:excinuclease UvrABC helicase subunit UvrB
MTETDSKQVRQAEFMRKHTLTDEDLRKMIQEKLERAKAYHKAKAKRERQVDLA